jgi:hypothetical protein
VKPVANNGFKLPPLPIKKCYPSRPKNNIKSQITDSTPINTDLNIK